MTDGKIDGLTVAAPESDIHPLQSEAKSADDEAPPGSELDLGTGADFGLGTGAGGGSAFGEDGVEAGTIISGGEALPITEEGLPDDDRGAGSA